MRLDASGSEKWKVKLHPQRHALPKWNFEIVEKPGQYRWIQFAWKARSRDTKGMALVIGREWSAGGYGFVVGEPIGMGLWGGEGVLASYKTGETAPQQWPVVRKDLWKMFHPSHRCDV